MICPKGEGAILGVINGEVFWKSGHSVRLPDKIESSELVF
jgi:hypothetical protein